MGKRKWRRVRLADLTTQEEQKRMTDLIEQTQDPRKRPTETAQAGPKRQ